MTSPWIKKKFSEFSLSFSGLKRHKNLHIRLQLLEPRRLQREQRRIFCARCPKVRGPDQGKIIAPRPSSQDRQVAFLELVSELKTYGKVKNFKVHRIGRSWFFFRASSGIRMDQNIGLLPVLYFKVIGKSPKVIFTL